MKDRRATPIADFIRLCCAVVASVAAVFGATFVLDELETLSKGQATAMSQSMVEAFGKSDHFSQVMEFAKWNDRATYDLGNRVSRKLVASWMWGGESPEDTKYAQELSLMDPRELQISVKFVVSDLTTMLECVCAKRCEKETITFAMNQQARYLADQTNPYWCNGNDKLLRGRPIEMVHEALNRGRGGFDKIRKRIELNETQLSNEKPVPDGDCEAYKSQSGYGSYLRCLSVKLDRLYLSRSRVKHNTYCKKDWQEYVNVFEFGGCLGR